MGFSDHGAEPRDGDQPAEMMTLIQEHGARLRAELQAHHRNIFPPESQKTIRNFSAAETAGLLGIAEGYLRQIGAERAQPSGPKNGRRSYSVADISELRKQLDQGTRSTRRYLPIAAPTSTSKSSPS